MPWGCKPKRISVYSRDLQRWQMERESDGWAQKELEGMNLGDARRNERAKTLLTRLAEKPTASIPHACHG
ncbi:IS4/Tn5 family transposase DNA-binding protein, partial [Ralstonia solanacearum]|uniref:IS4/Tn5 family transposase DNA-binding protein n=1 Tax=Ralstonia solanacearum TaxID=305 RepID=UPI0035EAC15A